MKTIRQTDIARMADISDAFMSEILAGKKSPAWETAKKLSKITGIKVNLWMENRTNSEFLRQKVKELNECQEAQ